MMLVLALGTQNSGSDVHATTPCFAAGEWNRPTRRVTRGAGVVMRWASIPTHRPITEGTERLQVQPVPDGGFGLPRRGRTIL